MKTFEPKTNVNMFFISGLASESGRIKQITDKYMIYGIKLVVVCFYLLFRPLFKGFFEARAEIQKHFRLFFGSNENFKICF